MAVASSEIQTAARVDSHRWGDDEPLWRRIYKRNESRIGFGLAALAIVVGWAGSDTRQLSAENGIGYALGIFSVTCMSILLVYPLRKRIKLLKFLGPVKDWFKTHMVMGPLAPVAALYHCNFQLGSLNSRIALFSALLVAGSGLVGRHIYRKIHHGLYGRKANLKELLSQVKLTAPNGSQVATFVPELMKRIAEFDRQVLVPPKSIWESMWLPFRLAFRTRLASYRLKRFSSRRLKAEALLSPLVHQHRKKLDKATRRYITNHLRQVRRVAEFNAYERLFALWHIVHLPFFYLLVLSTIVHVIAVHLY